MIGIWRRLTGRSAPPAAPGQVNPPGEAERLLRRLDFTVVRRLDGLRQGEHRNAAYGAGLDLAELREYQVGDDVRTIDWNVTARMSQPYVRRYHEDREITAWLVLDLSGSTDFGSARQSKRELLIDIAGTLARLLTARGDRVGALLYTGSKPQSARQSPRRARRDLGWWAGRDETREQRPAELVASGGGRVHTLQLLQRALNAAARVAPAGSVVPSRTGPRTDLAAVLEQAFRTATQRSLVIVLSDFLNTPLVDDWEDGDSRTTSVQEGETSDAIPWERALAPLARRHEVVGVWVRDPREIELPDVGVVTFEDAETGEQLVVDTSQPALRAAYTVRAKQRAAALERLFARSSAGLWQVTTAEPLVPSLVTFLEQRRRTSLGARRLLAGAA
jgi:uncharacterized protein (DUF58 family)